MTRHPARLAQLLAAVSLLLAACSGGPSPATPTEAAAGPSSAASRSVPNPDRVGEDRGNGRPVELAFAGDVHFQLHLAGLLDHPRRALEPIRRSLAAADVTMLNLESSITDRGTPDAKELEAATARYWFRTSPTALEALDAAGVDVVTMANNHGADFGEIGLKDTLAAIRTSPIPVVGIGRDRRAAFAPYRVTVRGTDFAFLGGDASVREGASDVWAAGPANPGVAAARSPRPRALLAAVRASSRQDDVVVVYLHWGAENLGCPTAQQRTTARALVDAGADVIVGSHAHVLLGSGWLGSTYVNYGLGNFLWYHNYESETGVLRLTVRNGQVVRDSWTPARIHPLGRPFPLRGADRLDATADWRHLRLCTGLAAHRDEAPLPPYSWSMQRIGPELRERMRHSSHHPGCPVPLTDLRYLRMTYFGFDGRAHEGEMTIHEDYAAQVATVFRRLYDARWPIRRMRLVDDYGGNDDRSMAANNTSGYNCRRVAGSPSWSAHAYGAAIDLNPVQNPYLSGAGAVPGAGRGFAAVERFAAAEPAPGVITARGSVVAAFTRIGWEWGGTWSAPDYQHFTVPDEQLPSR